MLEQFLNHIRQHSLCESSDKILLAVSGGLDSMVMLNLFSEAGFEVGVAHCNFQLRGSASEGDERFVQEACQRLKVAFFSKRFDTESFARQNDLSIQMAARDLRYSWFEELLQDQHYRWLATAHHVNDSIETILLNWIHGNSTDGFVGIPLRNSHIIRPLLFAKRDDIEAYAKERRINWREDSSNQTDDYQRNFIRHNIIPKLKELNPSLEATIQKGLKKIKNDLSFLESKLDEWRSAHISAAGSTVRIDKNGFQNSTFSSGFLWRVLRPYGFNVDQCENIVDGMRGQSGKKFLSTTHQLTIDRDHLILSVLEIPWEDVTIDKNQDRAVLGSWLMTIQESQLKPSPDLSVAVLDANALSFPLQWRTWKPGDYFYPLGMEHRQKLSDFLIDNKVSMAEKNSVTVLESNGQIVWVVGYRIDNRYKLTSATRSALAFSVRPHFI